MGWICEKLRLEDGVGVGDSWKIKMRGCCFIFHSIFVLFVLDIHHHCDLSEGLQYTIRVDDPLLFRLTAQDGDELR